MSSVKKQDNPEDLIRCLSKGKAAEVAKGVKKVILGVFLL